MTLDKILATCFQHTACSGCNRVQSRDDRMTEAKTGIVNPAVIDLFAVDQKSGDVLLVMNESREWTGGDEQLHELQEKFNTYASFILDGEMTEAHPELKGRAARIELRYQHLPSDKA